MSYHLGGFFCDLKILASFSRIKRMTDIEQLITFI